MSTEFDGTAEQRWSVVDDGIEDAYTILDVIKSTGADNVWQAHTSNYDSAGSYRLGTGRRNGGDMYVSGSSSGAFPNAEGAFGTIIAQATDWVAKVTSKAAGSQFPDFYLYRFDTGEWHATPGGPAMSAQASLAGGTVRFGMFGGTDWFTGLAAAHAEWFRKLTFEEIQSALSNRATLDIANLEPDWLTDAGDQFAEDLTGNGGDRILDSNTAPSAEDPPDGVGGIWTYGLLPPTVPPINTSPPQMSYATPTPHVGTEMSITQGGWVKFPTAFAYQWLRDGEEILGATDSTYTPTIDDLFTYLSVRVTASNPFGEDEAVSTAFRIRNVLLPEAEPTIMLATADGWAPRTIRHIVDDQWA